MAGHGLSPGDYEELRIALVMNGGVSLAVWIGGATHETNRAIRGEDVYGELLDLTATTARVDIVSGASAGGINGAILAMAIVFDADLSPLREVWLQRGSLGRLLHSPYDKSPASLLRGSERFLDDLRAALRDIQGSRVARPPAQAPIDLTLTTTMLHGEPNRLADDLGVVIGDVNHRGRFEFRRGEDVEKDPFADKEIGDRLALAARASASFPIAFEPVYCPIEPKQPLKDARLVDMSASANFKRSRFLLDGGILDNKPVEAALAAVFRQRANREVRRVLAYVVPAPGWTAVELADDAGQVPTIGQVALASLVELPRMESISAQLESIIEHNRLVRRKRQTRVVLMRQLKALGMRDLAGRLFEVYRRRRIESAADYITAELSAGMARRSAGSEALGRRRREWLSRIMVERPASPWVPTQLPSGGATLDEVGVDRWTWGAFTVEHIAEIMLDLFRRALVVASLSDSELRDQLKADYAAGYDLIAAMPRVRQQDRALWQARVDDLLSVMKAPSAGEMVHNVAAWADDSLRLWTEQTCTLSPSESAQRYAGRPVPRGPIPVVSALGWTASAMAGVIAASAPRVRTAASDAARTGRTEDDRQYARDLEAYVDYLAPAGDETAEGVLVRLLTLEVVQYATGTYADVPDQLVELVQVSANVSSPFGGPSSASEKLAGAQLGNFGGFYKKAWRANDWMFGRMDGSDRLVRILLNPARLARLYSGQSDAVVRALHGIAAPATSGETDHEFLEQHWQQKLPLLEEELAYLDHPDHPVPEHLPHCVEAVVARLHLKMLRDELPVLAGAIEDDQRAGAGDTGPAADFLAAATRQVGSGGKKAWANLAPADLVRLYTACQIGQERLDGEVGTDLFTSTFTRSLAVAASAVTGPHSGLGFLGRLLRMARLPLLIVDALAQNTVMQSRTATFISGAVLALGATIVGLDLFTSATAALPSWLVVGGTILFVTAVALALRRNLRLVVVWLVLVVTIWGARTYLPVLAQVLNRWLAVPSTR